MIRHLAAAAMALAMVAAGPAQAGEMLAPGVSEDTLSPEPALVTLAPQAVAYVRLKTVRNTPVSRDLISSTFKRIWAFARRHGLKIVGSPMEIMDAYEQAEGSWIVDAAIPVDAVPREALADAGDIVFARLPGGAAAQAAHRGAHEAIKTTHERIGAFLAQRGVAARGRIVEQHFDDPHKVPEERLRSAVTYFLE